MISHNEYLSMSQQTFEKILWTLAIASTKTDFEETFRVKAYYFERDYHVTFYIGVAVSARRTGFSATVGKIISPLSEQGRTSRALVKFVNDHIPTMENRLVKVNVKFYVTSHTSSDLVDFLHKHSVIETSQTQLERQEIHQVDKTKANKATDQKAKKIILIVRDKKGAEV
ncbi:hypothetical protein [Parashewanella tropica]|uniref:hypothetical protein n=1 Tax=Parashewanella tropica TaxID=2547970 RepID=UPI001059AB75|nr:hypothetical protein [Parashewanella tropica]